MFQKQKGMIRDSLLGEDSANCTAEESCETKATTREIVEPNENDVMCGRGGATLRHVGNKRYRTLIKSNKPLYLISMKEQKTAISRSIVAAIRNRRGRFLERAKDKTWYDIGDAKATEKTSQALREGQAKLRQELIDKGIIRNSANNLSGSFDMMFPPIPAVSIPIITMNIDDRCVTVSSLDDVHTMKSESTIRSRSLDSLLPRTDTVHPNHLQRRNQYDIPCHKDTSRGTISTDFQPVLNEERSSRHRCQGATITPPFNTKRIVRADPHMLQPLPFSSDGGMVEETEHIANNNLVGNLDDSYSIMTFEMDEDELLDDDDDGSVEMLPSSPSSTPLSPVTSHLRALTALNNMEPIKLERLGRKLSSFSNVRNDDGLCRRQQQQHHTLNYQSDGYNARDSWSV